MPLAKALRGSSHALADKLSVLIDEGGAIVNAFRANSDMGLLISKQAAWEIKVETAVSDLDSRLDEALASVKSATLKASGNLGQAGLDICNSIEFEAEVLTIYQNQLRGVGD